MCAWTGKAKRARAPMRLTSLLIASGVKRAAALSAEGEGAVGELPPQLAQRSHLVAAHRWTAAIYGSRRRRRAHTRPTAPGRANR
jgi:hypothetical protein